MTASCKQRALHLFYLIFLKPHAEHLREERSAQRRTNTVLVLVFISFIGLFSPLQMVHLYIYFSIFIRIHKVYDMQTLYIMCQNSIILPQDFIF